MSLRDLVERVPAQEEAIRNLDPEALCKTRLRTWIDFRTHLWGNESFQEMRPVEEINTIRGVVSPDHHVVATVPGAVFPGWGLGCERILVRPEHNEIEREIMRFSKTGLHVFVVTGQPGIGLFPSLSNVWKI